MFPFYYQVLFIHYWDQEKIEYRKRLVFLFIDFQKIMKIIFLIEILLSLSLIVQIGNESGLYTLSVSCWCIHLFNGNLYTIINFQWSASIIYFYICFFQENFTTDQYSDTAKDLLSLYINVMLVSQFLC